MSDLSRTILAFAVPLVVGRALETALRLPWGRDLAASTGNGSLATEEGRHMIRKYSAAAAAIALGAAFVLGQRPVSAGDRKVDRVQAVHTAAELVISAGALLKVAADYMNDRREMDRRFARLR